MLSDRLLSYYQSLLSFNEKHGYKAISIFIIIQLFDLIPILSGYLKLAKNCFILIVIISFILLILKSKSFGFGKTNLFLGLFIIWYLIVIVINRDLNFISNLKYYLYMILQLFILHNYFKLLNEPAHKLYKVIKSYLMCSNIIIIISLVIYLLNISWLVIINNSQFILGTDNGRLTGLFGNGNLIATVTSTSILLNIFLDENKITNVYTDTLLIICLGLTQSRGTFIAFAISYVVIKIIQKNKNDLPIFTFKSVRKSIVMFLLLMIGLFTIVTLGNHINNINPITIITNNHIRAENSKSTNGSIVSDQKGTSELEEPVKTPIIDRSNSDSLRKELLMIGIRVFMENPLHGVTALNIGNYSGAFLEEDFPVSSDHPILNNPHNIIVQILASSGLVGILLLFLYLLNYLREITLIIKHKSFQNFDLAFISVILFFLLISQLEWYIIFSSSLFASVFWLCAGALSSNKEAITD